MDGVGRRNASHPVHVDLLARGRCRYLQWDFDRGCPPGDQCRDLPRAIEREVAANRAEYARPGWREVQARRADIRSRWDREAERHPGGRNGRPGVVVSDRRPEGVEAGDSGRNLETELDGCTEVTARDD